MKASTKSILKSGWSIAFGVSLLISIALEIMVPGAGAILGWLFVAVVFIVPAVLMRELGYVPIRQAFAVLWCIALYFIWVLVHAFTDPGQTPKPNIAVIGGLVLCWRLLQHPATDEPTAKSTKQPPLPPVTVDQRHFYISTAGQESGPFLSSQLQTMWAAGSITATSYCWADGMSEWRPVTDLLDHLHEIFRSATSKAEQNGCRNGSYAICRFIDASRSPDPKCSTDAQMQERMTFEAKRPEWTDS